MTTIVTDNFGFIDRVLVALLRGYITVVGSGVSACKKIG